MRAVIDCLKGELRVYFFQEEYKFSIAKTTHFEDHWEAISVGLGQQQVFDINLVWYRELEEDPSVVIYWVNTFPESHHSSADYSSYEDLPVELIGSYEDLPEEVRKE